MIYNYFKKIAAAVLVGLAFSANAQVTIYSENFDGGTTCNTAFPAAWTSATGDWVIDETDACAGAVPQCTVAGSSGNSAMAGADGFGGLETSVSAPFSTVGYGTVTVAWNGYRTNGAPVVTFSYSINGGTTWVNVPFTDVADDDQWHALSTITLPSGAAGQASVLLAWEYTATTNGFFMAFDDLLVQGLSTPVYYWNGTGALHLTTSWGVNTNGTGANPPNFTTNNLTFHMVNNTAATLSSAWTVSGSGTLLYIGDGAGNNVNFTIPAANNITLSGGARMVVMNASTVTMQNTTLPAAANMSLATGSTVDYNHSGTGMISGLVHSNLTISGTSDKNQPGNFQINGILNLNGRNLVMSNSSLQTLILAGSITGSGTIRTGNSRLTINGTGAFGTITFGTGGTTRTISQLTINRTASGTLTFANTLTVTGTTALTNGTLTIPAGSALTMNGTITFPASATNGAIAGSTTSSINIGASAGAITNSIFFDQTSATTRALNDLIFNRNGQTLTIGNALEIWGTIQPTLGTIAAGSNLTIKSSATMKGRIGRMGASGSMTGAGITVETLAAAGTTGWTTLGVAGITGRTFSNWNDDFSITCPTCPDGSTVGGVAFTSITGYNEAGFAGDFDNAAHYQDIANITDAIVVGKGYWVYLGNGATSTSNITIDVTGSVSQGGLANISLTSQGDPVEDGWNLIANPYPSPISWTAARNGNGTIADAIYVWNPDLNGGAGDFAEYVGGVPSPAVGGGGIDDNIPTGQAFYVQVSGNTTMAPLEAWKTTAASANPLLKTTATTAQTVFRLNLTGGPKNANTETVFHFNTNATLAHDKDFDGYQMPGVDPGAPTIYSYMNSKNYKINGLPAFPNNFTIPVAVKSGYSGNYTIHPIDIQNLPAGACVNLYDKFTNTTHNLRTGSYTFNFVDTTTVPRFTLNITVNPTTLTSNVTNPSCNNTPNGQVIASGTTAGPWNYTWKNSIGAIIKTTTNVATPDTLKNIMAGTFYVDVNTVGTCDNAAGTFSVASTAPMPTANFTANVDSVYLGNGFTFTNVSSNATNYSWNFGDGSPFVTGASPSYTYSMIGNYNVILTAYSACGDSSSYTYPVVVMTPTTTSGISSLAAANSQIKVGRDANGVFVQMNYEKTTRATVSVSNILGQVLISPRTIEGTNEKFYLDVPAKDQLLLITVSTAEKVSTTRVFN